MFQSNANAAMRRAVWRPSLQTYWHESPLRSPSSLPLSKHASSSSRPRGPVDGRFEESLEPLLDLRQDVEEAHHLLGLTNASKNINTAEQQSMEFAVQGSKRFDQRRIAVGKLGPYAAACARAPAPTLRIAADLQGFPLCCQGVEPVDPTGGCSPDSSPPDPGLEETL